MGSAAPLPREGQTFAGASRWVRYANFVKLPHTVFALPFALVGLTLATYQRPVRLAQLGWVIIAFTAARFAAMGFNRIVDRRSPLALERSRAWGVFRPLDAKAMDEAFRHLRARGSSEGLDARMLSFEEFTTLLGLEGKYAVDERYKRMAAERQP